LDLIATATDTSSTIDGKNDAANIDQLHTIKGLIEVLKPRVVVLENTSGLVNLTENQPYFRKIIYDISSAGPGYSLRYNIINMADYGLPQERKRLIIIAAK
jgi:DNA (cytosine-5)-methyltransferase 1